MENDEKKIMLELIKRAINLLTFYESHCEINLHNLLLKRVIFYPLWFVIMMLGFEWN